MDDRADSRPRRRRTLGPIQAPAQLQAVETVVTAQLVELEEQLRRHAAALALTRSRRRATRRRN